MTYSQLLIRYPRYIGYGFLHYFFSGPGQTFFISLFVADFIHALAIEQVEFDYFYSLATLMSAFVLPWLGSLLDRIRLRYFSLGVGGAFVVFCLLAASVNSVYLLIVVLFGLRLCGQGLMPLTGATATARYFDQARGKALSLVGFGVSGAEIVLPVAFAFLIGSLGWRSAWLVVAALIVLVFVPMILTLLPRQDPFQLNQVPPQAPDTRIKQASRQQVMRDPVFYLLILIYLFIPLFSTGIIINKNVLSLTYGWTEAWLAIGLSVFGLTRLGTNLLFGPLLDRFSASRTYSFQLIPLTFGTLALWAAPSLATMLVFFASAGMGASINSLTGTALWAERYGTQHLGAIRSLVSMFMVFSTALGTILIGWGFSPQFGIGPTLWVAIGTMLGLTLLGFWQTRRLRYRR